MPDNFEKDLQDWRAPDDEEKNLSFHDEARRASVQRGNVVAANGRKSSLWTADGRKSSIATLRKSLSRPPGYETQDPFFQAPADSQEEDDEEEKGEEINYQTLTWWQCGMIMIAETISLGILSLPSVLGSIGMVPGIILIAGMGILATYSGYVIGQFRLEYPWVHSFGDAGEILFKPLNMGVFGKELFGWAQTIFQIFSMASHILTWTICFNTITSSATCTMVWGVIALIVFWLFDLPRTLKNVSYMSIASFCSIFTAVMITMIDVGVEKPRGDKKLSPFQTLAFTTAFNSVANITFAFAGHSCFFGFISELKEPRDWPKALALLQICDVSLYLISSIVIYVYSGDNVESPALGSASHIVKKAAWGIAIPTIIIAGVIYGHIAAKYIFVRILKGTKHINKRTKLSNLAWYGITLVIWIIAWIIAESIPNFNDLLALISALFASWFTYGLSGVFWLFINKGQWFSNWKKIVLFVMNVILFIIGLLICVLGLWSSGDSIAKATGGHSWSCASNSQ